MTTSDPAGTGPSGTYVPPPPPPPPGGYVPPPPAGTPFGPPGDVATIKVFFIVSLVMNAIATFTWPVVVFWLGAMTCGLGCVAIVVPLLTGAATVLDAIALGKIGQRPNAGVYSFLKTTAIFDIVAGVIGASVVPLVMGILALVSLHRPEVQRYYGAPPQ